MDRQDIVKLIVRPLLDDQSNSAIIPSKSTALIVLKQQFSKIRRMLVKPKRLNFFTQLLLLQENFEHFGLCDSKSAYFKLKMRDI